MNHTESSFPARVARYLRLEAEMRDKAHVLALEVDTPGSATFAMELHDKAATLDAAALILDGDPSWRKRLEAIG